MRFKKGLPMGYGRVLWLFGSVFVCQTMRSPRKWLVYPMVVLVFGMACLFYEYISAYQQLYIDALRGVYPVFYIQTNGMKVEPPTDSFYHREEVFEMAKSFKFKFREYEQERSLVDVGIRSFASGNPLAEKLEDGKVGPTIGLSSGLYEKVTACKGYGGEGIYVPGHSGEPLFVKLRKVELHGEQDWVLLPGDLSEQIGLLNNITTIFPKNTMRDGQVRDIYQKHETSVNTWQDRLPFFTTVFYHVIKFLYVSVISGLALLILVLGVGVIVDTINEFGRLINFSAIYGISKTAVQIISATFLSLFFSIFYISAMIIKFILGLSVKSSFSFMEDLVVSQVTPVLFFSILLMLVFVVVVYVNKKYSELGLISGQ